MVGLIPEPGNTEEWKKLLGDLTNLCGSEKFSDVVKAYDAGYENYPIQWKHIKHIDSDRGMHIRLIIDVFHEGDEASINKGFLSGYSKTFFKVVGKSNKGVEESNLKHVLSLAKNMARALLVEE